MKPQLTNKQQRFVEEYMVDLNASAAARRAGYSMENSGKIGSQLLEKTRIQTALQAQMKIRSEKVQITAEMVIREIAVIAFSDPKYFFENRNGELVVRNDLFNEPNLAKSLSAVSLGKNGISIQFHDKLRALELLLKHVSAEPIDKSEQRKAIFERLKLYMEKRQNPTQSTS